MPFTLMVDKKRGVKQKKNDYLVSNSTLITVGKQIFFFCFRAAIRAATRGLNETGEAVEICDLTPQNNAFFVNRFLYH